MIVLFIGCKNPVETELTAQSGWTIYHIDANFEWITPGIGFKKDYTCDLPVIFVDTSLIFETNGTWEVHKRNKKNYVKIHTKNLKFDNVEFEIKPFETIVDPKTLGKLRKLELVSDSIKITAYRTIL